MAPPDDSSLTPEQHVNRVLNTALILSARLDWESGQPARVFLEDGRRYRLDMAPLSREKMELLLRAIMDGQQRKTLEETGEVEFLHAPDGGGRPMKVRAFTKDGQLCIAAHPVQQP